jgi:hypothetical protein
MIIGLSGYARSGKDTVAGMLIGLYGYDNRAFATGIRDLLYEMNPSVFEDDHVDGTLQYIVQRWGWEEAKKYKLIRGYLQTLGVGARKVFGDDVWVSKALEGVSAGDKIVLTDVRFPNEAEVIKSLGGEIWRIQRPKTEAINNHPSESAMDDWAFDALIKNDSGMDNLKNQIQALLG